MNRDSSRCVPNSNVSCGTAYESYTPNNVGQADISHLIIQAVEHSLRHGLDAVYRLCWEAGRYLIDDDIDQCRVHLARAIAHADDPGRWIIRDALQLLEGLDEIPEATDAEVSQAVDAVSGGGD